MSRPNVAEAVGHIKTLPTLPAILTRIIATTADPDASALDLSRHVASDQSLTATLLKLVNSAYYGHYRQIDSITTAIVMLGFHEVRNLSLATTTFRTFPSGHANYDRIQLWRHSLAAAMAAERLANALGMPVEGCFVSGLLHGIGKVVFDVLYPECFQQAIREAHTRNAFIRDIEPLYLGMDHAAAGRLLAEQWDLPSSVVATIAHHHKNVADGKTPSLPDLVSVANAMTYHADLGEASNGQAPEALSDGLFGLTAQQWDALIEELAESRPRIDEFLGALP